MDVAVRGPGDDPLVPAYPNIVVQLMGYSVTLNEEISYEEGGSLASGSTWNRETVQTSSFSSEINWEVSGEVEISAKGASAKVCAKAGGALASTQTVSHAKSVGGSVLDERNWSRARATNPSETAYIKLHLKVHNFGTACASNIIPTLTLRIGGINVATFEPGNAQVNLLVPGGVYPPEEGAYWVVDSIDTGTAVTPLKLTLDELRALERGVPVSISVTQLKADVMSFDPGRDKPGWSSVGDVNEYLAHCDAVGANIHVEVGDGSFAHYLVFADDATSVRRVTLGDALGRIGMQDGKFHYRDSQGLMQETRLEKYKFVFDQKTLVDNGWNLTTSPATPPDRDDYTIADMVLGPETTLYVKGPREASDRGPTIHYANADESTRRITLCASDYQGIKTVIFIPSELQEPQAPRDPLTMREEIPGSGFYYLVFPDPDYIFDGSERVVVANINNQEAEQSINLIHYEEPPQPEKPVINDVTLETATPPGRIYAKVATSSTRFPIKWVRLYHPSLPNRYAVMEQSIESYKDPNGYEFLLPKEFDSRITPEPKIVAYVAPNVYTEMPIFGEKRPGVLTLSAAINWPNSISKLGKTTKYQSFESRLRPAGGHNRVL